MKILRYRADARSVAFLLLLFGCMAVQWTGTLRHPLLWIFTAFLAFVAMVINHNHQHCSTFVPRGLNRLFGVLLTFGTGQPAAAIVPMHNRNHHVHNNDESDFVRVSLVAFRWNLLNLLAFPFVAIRRYANAKFGEMRRWKESHARLYRQLQLERATFYPTLIILFSTRPLETLVYLICPYICGQWAIIAINLVQHDGCDPQSAYDHSRNFVGRWLNWWVLNNGFHTAHHQRPALHWSLLPGYHRQIRSRINPRLECRSLFLKLIEFYIWPGRRPVVSRGSS